jgi:ribonucleoside-diphosphate reductase alpha chain
MKLTENAIKVLERRYLARDKEGKLIEDPEALFRRVAEAVAEADRPYLSEIQLEELKSEFYEMMTRLEFLPNSPTLMNAGRPLGQLSACFVLPVEDSMEGIFDSIKNAALIHKSGGGTGFNFSRLRPAGSSVRSTGGVASGPISFMKVFNAATEAVKQGGTRRGANMGILRVDHPDIREFITCKQDNRDITNFNISVGLTGEFMTAVGNGEEYDLIDPRDGKPVRRENAREIFDLIIDHAWKNGEPGIIFLDRINEANVVPEAGEIESTNPCIAGDSWILTKQGPVQVEDILGKETKLALNGEFHRTTSQGFFKTGFKKTIEICTDEGYRLTLTEDHLVRTAEKITRYKVYEQWKAAGELKPGDRIILCNNRGLTWDGIGTFNEGYLLGCLVGDGTLKEDSAVISVWETGDEDWSMVESCEKAVAGLEMRSDFRGFQKAITGRHERRMKLVSLRRLAAKFNLVPGNKRITAEIEKTSYEFHRGFLRGLFDTDGTVSGNLKKGVSIRLWQTDLEGLERVQRMLHRLGIASRIYCNRKPDSLKKLPDGKGGYKDYRVKAGHELVISNDNICEFSNVVGFGNIKKKDRLLKILQCYSRKMNRERFVATITRIVPRLAREVYDVMVPGINAFEANCIYVHNCGEQPLLPYESCNLGSINLYAMLKETDGKYEIDFEKLAETVRKAVHFLDNVIDVNKYPLSRIEEMTKNTRKIGLGVMGWADVLYRLFIPYDSEEAVELAEKVMAFIRDEGRKASAVIAEKKGVFPYYDKSIYKNTGLKLRNATITTIAPTGTLSIIAGVSSGIEPLFAISYIRNVMDNDRLPEVNPVFREAAEKEGFYSDSLMERIATEGSIYEFEEIPENIRRVFITAHDISPEWHIRMQAAFQKYTDNAVSKTVNLRNDATRDDVKEVYELAYETGCKGVTIYRDGSREAQVLNIGMTEHEKHDNKGIGNTVSPRPRPEITTGFTEKVKIGCGNLYITANYDEYGICEVFTNLGRGGGCPSQSEATSRLISIALRSGMDVGSLVEQLKGIRCTSTIRKDGIKVMSCPDAIGRVIEKVMKLSNGNGNANGNTINIVLDEEENRKIPTGPACPECGQSVEHDGGCIVCRNCGFSKCG